MKLLKTLTVLILLMLPFGELLRIEVGNNIVLKPLDIVVGMTAIYFIFLSFLRPKEGKIPYFRKIWRGISHPLSWLRDDKVAMPLIFFALVGFLSLLINTSWLQRNEFLVALLYLLRWTSYAAIFVIVLQFDKAFKQKLKWFLFYDGLFILLVGYIQYFFFSDLKSWYHLGWDEHMYRMFSVFLDPNFAGAFFVLYFLFVGGMLRLSFRATGRSRGIFSTRATLLQRSLHSPPTGGSVGMTNILLCLLLLLTLLAIFLTFSRASLLMFVVSSGVFLFLLKKKKIFFGLIGIMLIFFISISSQFYIENVNIFRETSSKARLENYAVALRIIQDRPLVGVGFNSYRYAKDHYGVHMGWTGLPSHADAGVDNSFLFVLATTGVIGFIAYSWLWFRIITRAYNFYKKGNIWAAVVIASSIGLFVHALFINSLFFAPLMLWMWVIMGLLG